MKTRLPASIALALLGLSLLPACRAAEESRPKLDLQLDTAPLAAGQANARATSYADVVEPVQKAVVSVYSSKTVRQRVQVPEFFRQFYGDRAFPDQESRQEGLGSGVIVSKNGYILTNNHVVAEADELKVSLNDGREFEAKLIGADPKTDVAVIKIDAEGLPVATLADSDLLRVGDLVFAVGNPLGIGQTVTMGIVSATGRDNLGILAEQGGYENFIQTDAAINQGNSGGALIDAQGRLVGINTAIISGGGARGGNIGIGFAIPVNQASAILTSLVETGTVQRGYLGVNIGELKPDVAEALGLKKDQRGVIITNLPKDSPAEKAGLERSDVVTSIAGRTVTSPQELRNAVAAKRPGSEVEVRVLREGKERTFKVKLGSLAGAVSASELLPGVTVKTLDEEARRQIGAPRDLEGLVITEVAENSPYARRLAPGMVVVEVNRRPVADLDTAQGLIKSGRNLLIIYVRGMFTPVAVTVE
ncbi:MAG: Do family serine endopeptidase [Opitutaceae bacterium]|jgi:serine protease Do/serine protease DegQ|nr:Do family serine endopeptidase [Opitutaceae bacterium]